MRSETYFRQFLGVSIPTLLKLQDLRKDFEHSTKGNGVTKRIRNVPMT